MQNERKKHRFSGKIKIEVNGLNHARVLEKVRKVGKIEGVKSKTRTLSFWCAECDVAKIIAILEQLCYNYLILRRVGIAPALSRVFKRVGVLVGIALSVLVFAFYPKVILSVSVNDEDYEQTVKELLKENGVEASAFVWSIDCDDLSKKLLALDGVAYAKVTRQGTAVSVEIRRELEKPQLLLESATSVKSVRRAVVTRSVVFAGTAVVKYGDIVNIGDELIGGFITVGESQVPSNASGEVYGKVYETKTVFFARSEWENVVERRERQQNTAEMLLLSTLNSGGEVLQRSFAEQETDGGWCVTVTLEIEVKIS